MEKDILWGILTTFGHDAESGRGEWLVRDGGEERSLHVASYTQDTITIGYWVEGLGGVDAEVRKTFEFTIKEVK